MRQAGEVLRFWVSVVGLVIGLQSACIAAHADGLKSPDPAVEGDKFRLALLIKDVATTREYVDNGSVVQVSEEVVKEERERDHSTRSPQEMLTLFLKGLGLMVFIVLVYKGLKRLVLRRRKSE